jgi:hypothetical protein
MRPHLSESQRAIFCREIDVSVCTGLFHGLLFPTILARLKAQFSGSDQESQSQHQDVGENMAA